MPPVTLVRRSDAFVGWGRPPPAVLPIPGVMAQWVTVAKKAKAPLTKLLHGMGFEHLALLAKERKLGPEAGAELAALCRALASCGASPRGSGQASLAQRSGQPPARGPGLPAGGRLEGAARPKKPAKDSSARAPVTMEDFMAHFLKVQPEAATIPKKDLAKAEPVWTCAECGAPHRADRDECRRCYKPRPAAVAPPGRERSRALSAGRPRGRCAAWRPAAGCAH